MGLLFTSHPIKEIDLDKLNMEPALFTFNCSNAGRNKDEADLKRDVRSVPQ